MRFDIKRKERPPWSRWFAWHPVRINNQLIWLEHVERHVEIICDEVFIHYRPLEENPE